MKKGLMRLIALVLSSSVALAALLPQRLEATSTKSTQASATSHLPRVLQNYMDRMRDKMPQQQKQEVYVLVQLSAAPAAVSSHTEGQVLDAQTSVEKAIEEITGSKVEERYGFLVNGLKVRAKRSDLSRLRAIPGVLNVYEIPLFYPNMHSAVDLTEAS